MNVVVESNTSLTLKVGSSFIQMSPMSMSISSTMVNINSGGSGGSGSGSSPTAPTEPQEADDAVAGSEASVRSNPPPPPPKNYTPFASAFNSASQNGTPFIGL
jgi:type VI secretion system secreted protein VgrG